jgi:hypothetical protein
MNELNFNEEDKANFIEFLNRVATHAKFDMNTQELIKYYKLLSHMQTSILPKIEANILEVKRVVEAPKKKGKGTK